MFWKKKEKEEDNKLPDLPGRKITRLDLPAIRPDVPDNIDRAEMLEMSRISDMAPEMEDNEGFSPRTKIPNLPKIKDNMNVPSGFPRIQEISREDFDGPEIIPPQTNVIHVSEMHHEEEKGPVFIRLDKFKSAKSSLSDIKEKIDEINELLRKTREIRQKEEQELDYWEKETHEIQNKINSITENIFEKIE